MKEVFISNLCPKFTLVQNPPSIPPLLVAFIFCQLTESKFVIDWHNYGFSIMKIQKANSIIVRIAEIYEHIIARLSDANFTVTEAMRKEILLWGARDTHVLYDKPHPRFSRLSESDRTEFLERISEEIPELEKVVEKRVPLLLSSTSWTEDEDFSILLKALLECESQGLGLTSV